jgi:pyruvate dehydrogenase E2 component (dihydrolipoamide acetyltransferase)
MGEFVMPSLGADMDTGTVTQWLVQVGDEVHRGDVVAVVDTEKADIEVEIFEDGVVEELLVPEGTEVTVGTPLARIAAAGPEPAPPPPPPVAATETELAPTRWHAPRAPSVSPVVRRHAAELGVDLASVVGTGKNGGITRADVERAAGTTRAPAPAPARPAHPVAAAPPGRRRVSPRARRLAARGGVDLAAAIGSGPGGAVTGADVEAAPVTRSDAKASAMRAAIGRAMARSKREIPHYYLAADVDFSRARAFLDERNEARPVTERLLPAVLLLKATAHAAREVPELNGFWVDDELHISEAVHLGVAISLRAGGLVAPAIHDADAKTLDELMASLRDLVNRARAGSLRASEMSDPTITVTNLGDQGVDAVYGVIYPPQVALVGFGAVRERPWAVDGMVGAHPVVTASLAADHRASDGARGARFLTIIDRMLQEPEAL